MIGILASAIQVLVMITLIMLTVLAIKKSRIHFRLLQIDEPEEFAKFDYDDLSFRYKGSFYARAKLFFTLTPYYRKKTDLRDEEYKEIERELVLATNKLQIVCGGFILFLSLLIISEFLIE